MIERNFDYCALQFLNHWLDKEEIYCDLLSSSNLEDQRQALVKAGGYFRVARNVPKKYDLNGKRYQAILDILSTIDNISLDNVVEVVNEVKTSISKNYGNRQVLSLTTKFLWLKFKAPVRIYDTQARISLGTQENNYYAFHEAFSLYYKDKESEIIEACNKLENVITYLVNPNMSPEDIENIVSEQWFRERVLDMYLWNNGRK